MWFKSAPTYPKNFAKTKIKDIFVPAPWSWYSGNDYYISQAIATVAKF